jgi:inosose dehydratase
VTQFLEQQSFAGPIVVEQDLAQDAAETPLALARRNLDYLNSVA